MILLPFYLSKSKETQTKLSVGLNELKALALHPTLV